MKLSQSIAVLMAVSAATTALPGCSPAHLAGAGANLVFAAIDAATETDEPKPKYPDRKKPSDFPVADVSTSTPPRPQASQFVHCYDARNDIPYTMQTKCVTGDRQVTASEHGRLLADRAARRAAASQAQGSSTSTSVAQTAPSSQPSLPSAKSTAPTQPANANEQATAPIQQIPEYLSPVSSGSGFFITESGHVLTNHHVVEDCTRLGIFWDQVLVPTRLRASDARVDLAVVDTGLRVGEPAVFRSSTAELGESVYVFGYPLLGTLWSVNMTEGIVSSVAGPGGHPWVLQTNAPMQPGNSGGPTVDHSGRVVGVNVAQLKDKSAENVNFAIKSEIAVGFLRKAGVRVQLGGSATEISTKRIAKHVSAVTVPVICFN